MNNISKFFHYLRLKPFDTSSETGRVSERYRLLLWAVLTNVMSRGTAMLVIVLAVSLTIPYLGVERFGVWMAIISMASMLTFLDMGIGNALTNRIAYVASLNDLNLLRSSISGGVLFLALIALCVGVLLTSLALILPWSKIIKVSDSSVVVEVENACLVFAVIFAVGIFSNGVQRIFAGLQRGYEANIATLVFTILSMFVLVLVAQSESGVVLLLLSTLGVQQLVLVVLLLRLRQLKFLRSRGGLFAFWDEKNTLVKIGGLFFVLQLGAIVSTGMDGLLISSTLGSSQVAVFVLVQRMYQFVSVPVSILNAPLWGVYADAHARGEGDFIIRTFKQSLFLSLVVAVVVGLALALLSPAIFSVWTKDMMQAPIVLIIVYFFLVVFESAGNSLAMMLNGCSVIREQVMVVLFLMLFGVSAKIAGLYLYGTTGMLLGWLVIYAFCIIFFYGFLWRDRIRGVVFG